MTDWDRAYMQLNKSDPVETPRERQIDALGKWLGRAMGTLVGAITLLWLLSGPDYLIVGAGALLAALCVGCVVFAIGTVALDEESKP